MMPAGFSVFDSHFHIIDDRFPLIPSHGYLPTRFTCDDYRERMKTHDLLGGAVVSGSFQGYDQTYLVHALKVLGPAFVGVTQLPASVSDETIQDLARSGVRAVRFNLKLGGSEQVEHLDSLARRAHDVAGWHAELYVDSSALDALYPVLVALPAVAIDHLGLSRAGFPTLLKLAEKGARVKATGFGRVDFNVETALRNLSSANPNALMFGTDLPSTRAPRPYQDTDCLRIMDAVPEHAERVLSRNAAKFYRRMEMD